MEGADGRPLAANSGAVQLNRPASGLDDVFVHPNPHRAQRHDSHLTIAGLPTEATVRIFAASGQLVRVLEVARNRSGGRRWNLENERGETVPPGVYLIRVEAPGADPVLRKAAIIR
jgi:flagellar hook assembly protein FlgD